METRVDNVELRVVGLEETVKQILENQESFHAEIRTFMKKKNKGESDGDSSPERSAITSPRMKHSSYEPHFRTGRRKLEIPVFNGDDPNGWLVRVERYFRINGVKEAEKIDAVVIALEERALNWFQWWEEQGPFRTWMEFQAAVIRRFNPGAIHDPLGPLLKLKQDGTVNEYRDKFELLVAPLKKEERTMLTSIFRNGLKEEIQAELKLFKIDELAELMDLALVVQNKHQVLAGKSGGVKDRGEVKDKGYTSKFRSSWDNNRDKKDVHVGSNSAAEKSGEIMKGRKLSQTELEERSKKGLCFKCNERWGKGHMRLMLCEGESSDEEEFKDCETIEVEEFKTLLLSLHSKEGVTTHKSFKVWVMIGGRRLLTLIDSGATSSFIAPEVTEILKLNVTETPFT